MPDRLLIDIDADAEVRISTWREGEVPDAARATSVIHEGPGPVKVTAHAPSHAGGRLTPAAAWSEKLQSSIRPR